MGNNQVGGLAKRYGFTLRSLREYANLSVTGFSRLIKSSPAWLSYIEHGERVPSWQFVTTCLNILDRNNVPKFALQELEDLGRRLIMGKTFVCKAAVAVDLTPQPEKGGERSTKNGNGRKNGKHADVN